MTTYNCKTTQARLYEYLDGELPESDSDSITQHIQHCHACQTEVKRTKRLLGELTMCPSPDPGEQHWQHFPNQVLQAYKAEISAQNNTAPGLFSKLRNLFDFHPMFVQGMAYAVFIMFTATIIIFNSGSPDKNISTYLTGLEHPDAITRFLDSGVASDHQANIFAFSHQNSTNYFRLGTLYSYASVTLAIGDQARSIEYLTRIQNQLSMPAGASKQFDRSLVLLKAPSTTQEQRLSALSDLYSLLIDHLSDNTNHLDKTMLQLGVWTNYAAIAAASDNLQLLQQKALQQEFEHLARYSGFPPGVEEKIRQIHSIIASQDSGRESARRIEALSREIQTVLL